MSEIFTAFEKAHLAAHNNYRANHGCSQVKLSRSLCQFAQEWANNLAARGVMQHRSSSGYGENIYMMGGPGVEVTGKMPVDAWYDEIQYFQFGSGGFSMQTGHFTQVVWKKCTEIGVGKATNSSGQTFVVTNYNPPGNYVGHFNENVPRKLAISDVQPIGNVIENSCDDSNDEEESWQENSTDEEESCAAVSTSEDFTVFAKNHLKAHNTFRAQHGCPPLKLSTALCQFAQEWADNLAARGIMQHRNNSGYGENIYMMQSSCPVDVTGEQPVQSWYDEIQFFQFGSGGFSMQTGHFTQVVWKGSTEVGVGKATNRAGQTFVVANYNPPGNYSGQFNENVPRKLALSEMKSIEKEIKEIRTSTSDKKHCKEVSDTKEFTAFERNHLQAHNKYRAQHGCPPVQLSRSLCQFAQEWANNLAERGVMQHRSSSGYGENIYMMQSSCSGEVTGQQAVDSWYDEIQYFQFGCGGFSMQTGHFTQVVWKSTKTIGVGKASNRSGQTYVVTNYDPPGNYAGQFNSNVPRKCC